MHYNIDQIRNFSIKSLLKDDFDIYFDIEDSIFKAANEGKFSTRYEFNINISEDTLSKIRKALEVEGYEIVVFNNKVILIRWDGKEWS